MNHVWFFGFGIASSIVLACVLERTRTYWSPRWNGPIAGLGILLSGGWVQLMMWASNDIPISLPPYDLIAWVCWQWWIMFVVTITPILIWDKGFADKSQRQTIAQLTTALDEAKGVIREMEQHDA